MYNGTRRMRGYQVNLAISGKQASHAVISDISVKETKPTYAFAGTPADEKDQAIDLAGLRMAGSRRRGGELARSYLTSFRLDRAAGAFNVTVQTTTGTRIAESDGCQSSPAIVVQVFDFD